VQYTENWQAADLFLSFVGADGTKEIRSQLIKLILL